MIRKSKFKGYNRVYKMDFNSLLAGNSDFIEMTKNIINSNGGVDKFVDKDGNPDIMKMFETLSNNEQFCKTVMSVVDTVEDKEPQEVFGFRKEGTALGSWDGVFVGARFKTKSIGVVFEDGKDFVNNDMSWQDILKTKEEMIGRGWKEMTQEDIKLTSGI